MPNRNRRQFLEDSMFAAAAVTVTTGEVLADERKPSRSPNEKLGVAVVGVRGRGGSHIGAFAGRGDTEITYLCDPDSEVGNRRVAEVAKRQGGRTPTYVADIRQLLEDKSVDIVTVATPNHWHALASVWAMQAGKDVYVEKPVSHNVSEGRRMVQVARKYGRICQTGTQCRSNAGMRDAMEYIQAGKIGEVRVARGLCYKRRGSIGPRVENSAPDSVNYDLWLGPAPEGPVTRKQFHYDWHWQWPYGNGDLGNQGIHQMDVARWGLGVDTLSQGVFSYGGRFGYEDAGDSANTQVVVHDYGTKALVFEVRGLNTPSYRGAKIGVIFEGTEGYVVMTSYSSGAAFDPDGNKTTSFGGGGNHFANFLHAVRSRKHTDLTADIEQGHLSSALCHMGNISYQLGTARETSDVLRESSKHDTPENVKATLGRVLRHLDGNRIDSKKIRVGMALRFDPLSERFTAHDQANQMLSREYRKPFVVPTETEI